MHVEDYLTYKSAMDKGLLKDVGYQKQHIDTLETILDQAVDNLVPKRGQTGPIGPPNQFFNVALDLLSDKRRLQEANY